MSLSHSPKIVTDGLVFYYDMGNPQKSWKGAPATNYVSNADMMSGWGNYSNGTPVPIVTPFGTSGYGFYNAGSWNGLAKGISIPSTGTYTFSAWIKWIGGSSNVTGGAVYISGWGGGDSAAATNRTQPGVWQRISITLNCTTTSMTFYLINWGGTNNADNSSWEMTMPQVEAGSFATPFVNGTRTNTQAILDLTGKNTVTASSLTYNSDGSFGFNGVNDYVSVSRTLTTPITISGFVKYSSQSKTVNTFINSSPHGVLGISINRSGGGQLVVYIGNGSSWLGTPSITSSENMTVNIWYNITFISNGVTSELYLNGVNVGSVGHAPSNWGSYFEHGRVVQGGEYFSGSISNTQIYNRALSPSEVKQNFNALRGRYGI
jgi:hypothetical protein